MTNSKTSRSRPRPSLTFLLMCFFYPSQTQSNLFQLHNFDPQLQNFGLDCRSKIFSLWTSYCLHTCEKFQGFQGFLWLSLGFLLLLGLVGDLRVPSLTVFLQLSKLRHCSVKTLAFLSHVWERERDVSFILLSFFACLSSTSPLLRWWEVSECP